MSWWIFIIFILYIGRKNNKDSYIIDPKRIAILVILFLVVIVSGFLNHGIMTDPRNDNTSSDLWLNYLIPFSLCFLGLCIKKLPNWVRILLLFTGFFYFGYLALHYLIGFHNPYWENLNLSPLHWLHF